MNVNVYCAVYIPVLQKLKRALMLIYFAQICLQIFTYFP